MSGDQVARGLAADPWRGLAAEDVARRRLQHGWNLLTEAPPVPPWRKLARQFNELLIWILIAAATISGAVGEWADTAAILAIVLVNGIIGFLQEEKAGRSLAALRKLSAPMARAIRAGALQSIPAHELVPGDRIELEAGDNVPADARLLSAFGVRVQEAALTGESVPVDKDADCLPDRESPSGDRSNLVCMGTVIAAGRAGAIVVATGMNTELGQIAGLLQRSNPEPTPLQRRLAELGRWLVVVSLDVVAIIFVLQLVRGGEIVETPGSVTVICSNKTGTLTRTPVSTSKSASCCRSSADRLSGEHDRTLCILDRVSATKACHMMNPITLGQQNMHAE